MGTDSDGIDRTAPDRLRRQGGDRLLLKLADSFLSRTPGRLAELRAAEAPGAVADLLHAFKTSCHLVGAVGMAARSEALEQDAEDGALPDAEALDAMEADWAAVRAWLEEVRATVGEPS